MSYLLLGVGLPIALGLEFVNGFHDTTNAVATVIYTHPLPPNFAVVWSGFVNFLGVLFSSGAVAFGIISLLPVELILQVGSGARFAMVFALLLLALRALAKSKELYEGPKGNAPPPWWIRGLLIVTRTGVSFAHGSNLAIA